MTLDLRPIHDDEWPAFSRVVNAGFGQPTAHDEIIDRELIPLDRTLAVFDGDEIVGTAASYSFDLTVPGGAAVAAAGVSEVVVLPTHRRQGVLRRMMAHQLDDSAGRGDVVAILNASESSIYGRFGYGLASRYQVVRVASAHGALRHPPTVEGRVRLVPKEAARDVVAPAFEAIRRDRVGYVARDDLWWDAMLGDVRGWKGGGPLFVAVFERPDGLVAGYTIYEVDRSGTFGCWRAVVQEQAAIDDEVDAALWQYLFGIDLVETVERMACPLDDPLEWRLADPRHFHTTALLDFLWLRVLDVVAALEARTYGAAASVVVDVDDPVRADVAGRYRLDAADGGRATCKRTEEAPDVAVGVDDLGALYLGGVRASTLARAGRIRPITPGAVAMLDAMFATDREPFCPTRF